MALRGITARYKLCKRAETGDICRCTGMAKHIGVAGNSGLNRLFVNAAGDRRPLQTLQAITYSRAADKRARGKHCARASNVVINALMDCVGGWVVGRFQPYAGWEGDELYFLRYGWPLKITYVE